MFDLCTMRHMNERMEASAQKHIKEILRTYELQESPSGEEVVVVRNFQKEVKAN